MNARQDHGIMYNWFASSIIMQTQSFHKLPNIPQGQPKYLSLSAFLPSEDEEWRLKDLIFMENLLLN